MRCPKCGFEQPDGNSECVRCGIIFEKFMAREIAGAIPETPHAPAIERGATSASMLVEWLKELVCFVQPNVNPIIIAGRAIVYVAFFIWGWRFILTPPETNSTGESFMHLINLPFHEAGHIIFSPFGRFLHVLGGTLGQLLIPLICMGAFLLKNRDAFGASIGLWWLGQNFMDLAPYINDAKAGQLILLGGVTGREVEDYHDWEVILRTLGWMQYDHSIARLSYGLGILLMITTFIWGGYILYLQFRNLDRT